MSFCKDKNHKNCGFQQCGQPLRSEVYIHDKFEEFKWVIKSRKSKNIRYNDPKKERNNMTNKTMIYRTMHRKLEIEQHESHKNRGWSHVLRKGKRLLLHMWHSYKEYHLESKRIIQEKHVLMLISNFLKATLSLNRILKTSTHVFK